MAETRKKWLTLDDFHLPEDPDMPGWIIWGLSEEDDRYNSTLGTMWARESDNEQVIVRTKPGHLQGNLGNAVHGGAIMTHIDIAIFVASRLKGLLEYGPAVTLDLSTQFLEAGEVGQYMDAEVDIVKTTGRMVFLRGLMKQLTKDGKQRNIASFHATIRRSPPPRPK